MASKLIERFMHRRNLLYHRCQDWEGSRSFFESVADWLASMGNSDFSTYLATPSLNPPMQPVCWLKPWRVHRRCS